MLPLAGFTPCYCGSDELPARAFEMNAASSLAKPTSPTQFGAHVWVASCGREMSELSPHDV